MTRDDSLIQLSVLMPVRDGSKFLQRAIRSTLRAMPPSSELLIVDDGSRDNSIQIAMDFIDPRVIVLENQGQNGLVHALNFGLSRARGKYLARMDSDDICLPWRFLAQLRLLKTTDADFVFATAIAFGRPIRPYWILPQLPLSLSDTQFKFALTSFNPAVHPTMVARADVISRLGGYRDVPAEDLDLWLRAALAKYTLHRGAMPCLGLRLHGRQISRSEGWLESVSRQIDLTALRDRLARDPQLDGFNPGFVVRTLLRLEAAGLPKFASPWKKKS